MLFEFVLQLIVAAVAFVKCCDLMLFEFVLQCVFANLQSDIVVI